MKLSLYKKEHDNKQEVYHYTSVSGVTFMTDYLVNIRFNEKEDSYSSGSIELINCSRERSGEYISASVLLKSSDGVNTMLTYIKCTDVIIKTDAVHVFYHSVSDSTGELIYRNVEHNIGDINYIGVY